MCTTTQKASVGMYSGCDTLSLQILFVHYLVLPSLLHPSILFNCKLILVILYTMKNIFQMIIFLYSPCPNLEGIKDALCYKFRRPTIGQNCSAMCINKGSHRDAFSNERRKVPHISRGLLSRPHATEPRVK